MEGASEAVAAKTRVVGGSPRLASGLPASPWELAYPDHTGADHLAEVVALLRAAGTYTAARESKSEAVDVDLRPDLHEITCHGTRARVVLRHGEPPVRPTEVHATLAAPWERSSSLRVGGATSALAGQTAAGCAALDDVTRVTRSVQGAPAGGIREALTGELIALGASPPWI